MNRKAHWEEVYRTRPTTEVSWFQAEPALSLALIRTAEIGSDEPIIDIGGGASLLVDRLLAEGFAQLTVLDISGVALSHARGRLGSQAEAVEWIEGDVTHFEPPRPFALWHDRAVFHFLTEVADRRRYVQTMARSLRPGGEALIATFAVDGPTRCSGLEVVQYDRQRLTAEVGEHFTLLESLEETHTTPANAEQRFAWFRLRKR